MQVQEQFRSRDVYQPSQSTPVLHFAKHCCWINCNGQACMVCGKCVTSEGNTHLPSFLNTIVLLEFKTKVMWKEMSFFLFFFSSSPEECSWAQFDFPGVLTYGSRSWKKKKCSFLFPVEKKDKTFKCSLSVQNLQAHICLWMSKESFFTAKWF